MSELKPCPFCGGEAEVFGETKWSRGAFVGCLKCRATIGRQATEAEAIEAWNARYERTCHAQNLGGMPYSIPILLCDSCGAFNYAKADGSAWNFCPNCGAKVVGE